ncbi:hypothetical protein IJG96_02625 [Candidatus Saccharibacteria bacterium]|nr:hypothetical protein [Candidatus Saccharibacteria bacterium]MBR0059932.1 hypothetical protein [Selenomonadaceae bacterium]
MPEIKLHEDVYDKVHDYRFLAKLAMDCVRERKNANMLCGIIRVLLRHEVFGEYFDHRKIPTMDSVKFFQDQFARATTIQPL